MTSSNEVMPGDIWLSYLHYVDLPQLGKVRPVLVVKTGETSVIALKVTTRQPKEMARALTLNHWESYGLKKPSYLRLDQIFEVPLSDLLGAKRIGALKDEYLKIVFRSLGATGT